MYHLLAIHILSKALNFVLHPSTETTSDDNTLDVSDDEGSPPKYELPVVPEGYCRCQNWRISGRGSRTVRLGGW